MYEIEEVMLSVRPRL